MASPDKYGDFVRQLTRSGEEAILKSDPRLAARAAQGVPLRAMADELSTQQKMATDPNVLRQVARNMQAIEAANPQLASRLAMGDPDAVMEAYQMVVAGGGRVRAPKGPRQMELPMGDEPRGLVPYGTRGAGVPVGGVRGPGSAVGGVGGPGVRQGGMIPSGGGPLVPAGPRGLSTGGERGLSVPDGASPGWRQLAGQGDPSVIDAEFEVLGPQRNLPGGVRNLPPPVQDASGRWIYPAMGAAALGGAAALAARQLGNADLMAGQGSDTADLAAETRPVPSVATQEEPAVVDYAAMAREKIRQANEIQLREGRVTPESAALANEANALYQKAAEGRRTGSQPPIMPVEQQNAQTSAIRAQASQMAAANQGSDYRSQARRLLAELNARASEGTLTAGERQQMMAEINRLYALADAQANQRRAG